MSGCEIEKLLDTLGIDAWHHPSMVSVGGHRYRIIMNNLVTGTSAAAMFGNSPRDAHAGKIKKAREARGLLVVNGNSGLLSGAFSAAQALLSEMLVAVLRVGGAHIQHIDGTYGPDWALFHPEVAVLDARIEGTYGAATVLRLTCIAVTEKSPPFDLYAGIQINPLWNHQVQGLEIWSRQNRAYHSCIELKNLVVEHQRTRGVVYSKRASTHPMLAVSVGNTSDEACFGMDVIVSKAVTKAMLATT